MFVTARLEPSEAATRRSSPRRKLQLGSTLVTSGDEVTIHDISSTGMLIETSAQLESFEGLEVDLPHAGPTQAIVVWNSGRYFGCEFVDPISKAAISAALLRNPIDGRADPAAAEAADVPEIESETDAGRLSFANRMRIIIGTSIALWALILWAVGIF